MAKQWQPSGVDFIHIEIYKDNDPAKGTNHWVDQWKLPSEPFTFVVDRTGVIRERFEGAFSADRACRRPWPKVANKSLSPADYALPVSRVLQSLPVGERIGIAFSGGLDTAVAVAWIREKGGIPYAFTADLGQVDEADVADIPERALAYGAGEGRDRRLSRAARCTRARRAPVRRVPRLERRQDLLQHDAARPRGHRHDARPRDARARCRHLGRRLDVQGQRHRALLPLRAPDEPRPSHLQAVARRPVRGELGGRRR